MEVKLAAAKTSKYAVSESGDSLEITERPKGGMSIILADGQGSGKSAKQNSNMVVAKCVSMIGEGARDGAVARAVHDMLYAARDGKVSAELLIASADTASETLLISRNTACPVLIYQQGEVHVLTGESHPIGVWAQNKPCIDSFPLQPETTIVGFSDGIWFAGRNLGNPWGIAELTELLLQMPSDPNQLVDNVLTQAISRDQGRARDDMTVFALTIDYRQETEKIRRLSASFPV